MMFWGRVLRQKELERRWRVVSPGSAGNLPSFNRIAESLKSESGRLRILACVRSKVPLHGRGEETLI